MKRKPIRINWDDLESAFDNPNQDMLYYLDLVDGHVFLEGEGEEADDDEDDDYQVNAPSASQPRSDDGTRAYIEPLSTDTKIAWVESFISDTNDLSPELLSKLNSALESDDPAQGIIDALREDPEGKDRWYLYRADRVHDLIDDWLAQNEIAPTNPPPWAQA